MRFSRTRTKTNPNGTVEANAAGRRGVRVRSANVTFKNQEAWGAKCLAMREVLVGGVHSGSAHRKAPDLWNAKFHYMSIGARCTAHPGVALQGCLMR